MTYYSALHYAAKAEKSAQRAAASATDVSIYNFKNKITNCIIEVPQDIKIQLSGGTITSSAGSRMYIPAGKNDDGSLRFDVVQISEQASISTGGAAGKNFLFCDASGSFQAAILTSNCFSGSEKPATGTYQIWYDTANNLIKRDMDKTGVWVATGTSLPIGMVTSDGSILSSIDQVFNGFGYIGSTVYALPGVKGLIPNGRNEDGSLKNIEIVLDGVKILNNPDTNNKLQYLMLENNGAFTRGNWYYEQTQAPSWVSNNNNIWYNPETNKMYYYRSSTNQSYRNFIFTGLTFRGSNGSTTISEFNQAKLPFRAVDQNDFNKLDEEVTILDAQNVKLTGNQTIGGVKRFTNIVTSDVGTINFVAQNNNIQAGVTPTSNQYVGYDFRGKDGTRLAYLGVRYGANGEKQMELQKLDSSLTKLISGFPMATPTPASTSNDTTVATTAWVNNKLVYDSGDISLSNNTNNVITLPKSLDSASLHRHQIFVLLKPTETLQNFSTSMYLNAQSGYFYEKNNSISGTCGILTGLSTTQIRYKTGNNAIYYAEGSSYIYDWTKFKVRFLIYKI